ncbi:MAG: TetR/AcrR family transcriptional regulator [Acidimicrobiales bacterium]
MRTVEPDPDAPATPMPKARRRRGSVTRDNVLRAALDLVDRDGLDALSMRRLAGHLDVETMSLYKRVASKDDLLAGIAEVLWAEVAAAAAPSVDWRAWLGAFGHAIRTVAMAHPHAVSLLVAGEVFPPALLEVIATQLEHVESRGVSRSDAVNAMCTVTAFALGCTMAERACFGPDHKATSERQQIRRIARALPPDTDDRILDTALTVCGCDPDDMFHQGLDLIIRGSCTGCD